MIIFTILFIIVEPRSLVKSTLRKMSIEKSIGPKYTVWKCVWEKGIVWLTKIVYNINQDKLNEWRESTLVTIYKNKGDIQNCTNYRGIKLMSLVMKLWERIFEQKLRHDRKCIREPIRHISERSTI